MSLPEVQGQPENPYRAPQPGGLNVPVSVPGTRPGLFFCAAWLFAGILAQVCGLWLFLLFSELGNPVWPTLHSIATAAATVIVTIYFLSRYSVTSAIVFSQLLNATQWTTFVLTLSVLPGYLKRPVGLAPAERIIVVIIVVVMALILGAISFWKWRSLQRIADGQGVANTEA